jgi:toxin ParE1/3/4
MPARIFAPAERRLLEIWDYTWDKWGEKQADAYVRTLIESLHALGGQQHLWRPVGDKALGGLWVVRHKHHDIFFRQLSGGGIGVITILHENMDLPARLKENNKLAGGP